MTFSVNGVPAQTLIDWTPPEGYYGQVGFYPGHKIRIACPLMRPSVLRKEVCDSDFEWEEFSCTLDTIPVDRSLFIPLLESSKVAISLEDRSHQHQQSVVEPVAAVEPPPVVIDRHSSPCEHPLYQVLHNVSFTDDGIKSGNNSKFGYAICKKQMSQKLSYFEVEIVSTGSLGVALGVSDGQVCINECLGRFRNSVAFASSSGKLLSYTDMDKSLVSFESGDVIGCLIQEGKVKLNKHAFSKNQHYSQPSKIFFYKNALFIGETCLPSSMNYLYPTVCLMDQNSCVQIHFTYGLSPQSYFDSHKITDGYLNFAMPTNDSSLSWKSIQNCSLIEEGSNIFLSVSSDKPSIKQSPCCSPE